ncbi:Arabinanase/levansucrase/invertase [Aspergillus sclerotiicarbonarius CBS 121057]|uniref:Arabinanase/levansucrase/invertase n=1 Tax=Aspergillus sclerotiicarbonarius (strain CBS 121057 / IBT 28362) TaxID=1448318 RepID=A0A319DX69_ASPSB|nr:Arabinanase/levansucrase/invertase [Aspergillus sclerotiicarbonarius CBS 121057]
MKRIRSILNRDRSPPTTWIQSAQSNEGAEGISPAKLPSPEEQGARASMIWTRKKVAWLVILIFLGVAIIVVVVTVPVVLLDNRGSPDDPSYHNKANRPIRSVDDFPDPGLVHVNGTWYAYGTDAAKDDPNVPHVPVATSKNFSTWALLQGYDVLPTLSGWETNINHYAPDVIQREDGRFVLYYSGELKDWLRHHCVGAAVSNGTNPLGPYVPRNQTLACPRDQGGAIDPAPFKDADGTLYVVYKADGNSIGHGGDCNNGKKPIVPTPILLQQLQNDGVTPVGDPVEILTNEKVDGPLVEAPVIILTDQGVYYLFFSSHCYTSPKYNVKYAYSTSLRGPYIRAERPLFKSGDFGLKSPGGATPSVDGTRMVFHANCGGHDRCMYAAAINISANYTITPAALIGT